MTVCNSGDGTAKRPDVVRPKRAIRHDAVNIDDVRSVRDGLSWR